MDIYNTDLSCANPGETFNTPYDREKDFQDERVLVLTPWTVQNICYEIIKNYMVANPPQAQGYKFSQKYDIDDFKSDIFLDIAFNFKDAVVQKRPGIFVSRGPAEFRFPTLNQMIASNPKESEKTKYAMVNMPLVINIVATNVGFTEQLAEYIFKIFLHYQEVIRNDFCIRQFALQQLAPPQLYLESKDHFLVTINANSVFDMGAVIKGDHLKLKTIQYKIFLDCLDNVYN